jgi:hypothetical protein
MVPGIGKRGDSSQSVSQQGVLCGDANMLENQVRDNKPLNTFDAQPYEARSMLLPYRQEMSVLTGASEESTASDRCPSSPIGWPFVPMNRSERMENISSVEIFFLY